MRVLVVHNSYGGLSGEEMVVNAQISALKENGVDVECYLIGSEYSPKSLCSKVSAFIAGIYNPFSHLRFLKVLNEVGPDVVHFHNIYPWISHGPMLECVRRKLPYVITAHNYRMLCPSATLCHNGELYLKGVKGWPIGIVQNNVFGNLLKSVGYYLRFKIFTWLDLRKKASAVICVSEFVGHMFEDVSVTKRVIYNPITCVAPTETKRVQRQGQSISNVGFLGRFTIEKGADLFLGAAECLPKLNFFVAGESLENKIVPDNVELLGRLSRDELIPFFEAIDVLIVPSIWYEPFGLVVIESVCHGVPVIVSDMGALPELAGKFHGCCVFDSKGGQTCLAQAIEKFSPEIFLSKLGENKKIIAEEFSTKKYANLLVSLYSEILNK